MQRRYDELKQHGADVLVISFSPPEGIPRYVAAHGWRFPVVSDPRREAYRAFGLESGSWWRVAGPRVIGRYLWLLVRGRKLRKPSAGDDFKQLGGDFVLDADRRLVYAHPSRDPTDRPTGEALVGAVAGAAGRGDA